MVTLVVLVVLLPLIRRTAPMNVLLLSPVAVWPTVATCHLAEMLRMERG